MTRWKPFTSFPILSHESATAGNELAIAVTGYKRFTLRTLNGNPFYLAFVAGLVATPTEPYITVPEYCVFDSDFVWGSATLVAYVSPTSNDTIIVEKWA